jgi:WD40 repeat protein
VAAAGDAGLAVVGLDDGRTVAVLLAAGATTTATALAMRADGMTVWADRQGTLHGWAPATGAFVIGTVGGRVSVLRFAPDGGRIAAASDGDGSVSVWTTMPGREPLWRLATGSAVHGLAWTPDRRMLAAWSRTRDQDRLYRVRICSAEDGTVTAELAHDTGVYAALPLADGTLLTGTWDGVLRRWSPSGAPIAERAMGGGWISAIVRLADGRIATAGNDGTLRLAAGAELEPAGLLAGHRGPVVAMVELEGRLISGGADGTIRMWDPERRAALVRFASGVGPARVHWRDGRLEIAGDSGAALWDGSQVPWIRRGPGSSGLRRGRTEALLASHPDGILVVRPGVAGDGVLLAGEREPVAWAVRPGDDLIALAGATGGIVLRDLRDGSLVASASSAPVASLIWAGPERLLTTPVADGRETTILDHRLGTVASLRVGGANPYDPAIHLRAIPSPDGSLVALLGPDGARIIRSADGEAVPGMAALPVLMTGAWLGRPAHFAAFRNREALLIDPATGRIRTAPGHREAGGLALAVAPDGLSIASGGRDQEIRIHRTEAWDEPLVLTGHAGSVHDLA